MSSILDVWLGYWYNPGWLEAFLSKDMGDTLRKVVIQFSEAMIFICNVFPPPQYH